MKEIFDDYVNNSFGSELQEELKFNQFEYNYKKHFPEELSALVLDVGIGRGEMLTCMKNWGYKNYLGIDISPSTVQFCKSLCLNCELVDDSQLYLLEHKEHFSVITLLDVLEHIKKEKVVAFLKALHGALKPGGVLIIQVPNSQSPDSQLHRYNDITHEVGYIEHSLTQVLTTAGFQNIYFAGFECFFDNNWRDLFKKKCRSIHWLIVRLLRTINGNINPSILHPVFYSIVRK